MRGKTLHQGMCEFNGNYQKKITFHEKSNHVLT